MTDTESEGNVEALRGQILKIAKSLTLGDRNRQHGEVHENMADIAQLWTVYLNVIFSRREILELRAEDACHMMVLMKMARAQQGQFNLDDFVDGSAYMAMAGECADRNTRQGGE